MRPISRRLFLAGTAAVVVGSCSDDSEKTETTGNSSPVTEQADATTTEPTAEPATTSTLAPVDLHDDPFTLGVASGDPDATSVVLWTRLAPNPLEGGGMPEDEVPVEWEVSASADFSSIEASGVSIASAAYGHSLHTVVELGEGDWYYRFRVSQYTSPVGVTHTSPAADTAPAEVRFAAASCQNYSHGYYAAHRDIAEQRPDFVLWLGDYIYESAGEDDDADDARVHVGPEPTTIVEYRNRYALYKSDPHLKTSHATCPWFVVWDDHEVENNYAGLTPQNPADAADFANRRAVAYQAWWEHQPTRLDPPEGSEFRIYREAAWGGLLTLALLDGRQYRSDQACGDVTMSLDPACPETTDPSRTMLGEEQEQWLYDTLDASTAVWNMIGNQVVMADATFNGAVLNYDQWDGYPVERERILQHLAAATVPNVVVITGDIHLAAVAQLSAAGNGARTPVGVEFITTSISSDGLVGDELTDVLKSFPELVDAELLHRGYSLHTVTPESWTAEYRIVADVDDPDSAVTTLSTYLVMEGSNTVAIA
jgi:alkaline phosphatase D